MIAKVRKMWAARPPLFPLVILLGLLIASIPVWLRGSPATEVWGLGMLVGLWTAHIIWKANGFRGRAQLAVTELTDITAAFTSLVYTLSVSPDGRSIHSAYRANPAVDRAEVAACLRRAAEDLETEQGRVIRSDELPRRSAT